MISLSRPQPKSCCFCVGIPLPNTTVYQVLYNTAPGFSLTSSPATVPVFPLSPPRGPLALLKHANAPMWCFSSLYSASSRAPLPRPQPQDHTPICGSLGGALPAWDCKVHQVQCPSQCAADSPPSAIPRTRATVLRKATAQLQAGSGCHVLSRCFWVAGSRESGAASGSSRSTFSPCDHAADLLATIARFRPQNRASSRFQFHPLLWFPSASGLWNVELVSEASCVLLGFPFDILLFIFMCLDYRGCDEP